MNFRTFFLLVIILGIAFGLTLISQTYFTDAKGDISQMSRIIPKDFLPAYTLQNEDILGSATADLLDLNRQRKSSVLLLQFSKVKSLEAAMIRRAKDRKDMVRSLMREKPGEAVSHMMNQSEREKFPTYVQRFIEQKVDLSGVYEDSHSDDFVSGRAWHEHSLHKSDGSAVKLFFSRPADADNFHTGDSVTVSGYRVDDVVLGVSEQKVASVKNDLASASHPKTVGIILLNFQNDTSTPYTADHVKDVTFRDSHSVKAYYEEASAHNITLRGRTDVTGDVFGWYTITSNNTGCDLMNWANQALTQATSHGYTYGYDYLVYAFPYTASCPWSGIARVLNKVAFVNGDFSLRVVAHEVGHLLSMNHASSMRCVDSASDSSGSPVMNYVALSGNCSLEEYGDPFDVMGGAVQYLPNAYLRYDAGLINRLQTINSSGTYSVYLPDLNSPHTQLLQIPIERNPYGLTQYYYIDYRQASFFDNFSPTDFITSGVSLRIAGDADYGTKSYLIDMHPETSSMDDAPLTVGSTFQDVRRGIEISVLSLTPTYATLDVKVVPSLICQRNFASVTLSPPTGLEMSPGQNKSVYINYRNNDSASCYDQTVYATAPSFPTQLQLLTSFPKRFQVAPTHNYTFPIEVKSFPTTPLGVYSAIVRFDPQDMPFRVWDAERPISIRITNPISGASPKSY